MTNKKVRVRFAPSPTGPLHMGGVRTALFNYLFAKRHGGDFLLRIEDTDQTRFVPGAEEYIVESLKWCGITPDEGFSVGGEHGPYRQSERADIYREYAMKLVESGNAYYAFDTPEEMDALRQEHEAEKKTFIYNNVTRKELNNSIALSAQECDAIMATGAPFVVRFRMPENETINLHDAIRGNVSFNSNDLDDKVLFKSDGLPTYHLANVVDDYMMKISHVIRGEEWLPSMPLHALLYKALGWTEETPIFSHLPLILKPVGKGKLSKRDGDKLGFPVFPMDWKDPKTNEVSAGYKEQGYLPEAFLNMLAFLGWNPGTEQEIFSLEGLSEVFSLEKVGKAGAKFDPEKTKWFNHQYIVASDDKKLADMYMPILKEKGVEADLALVTQVVGLVKERVNFVHELWDQSSFFFEAPTEYDAKVVKKRWKNEVPTHMINLTEVLRGVDDFSSENTEAVVKEWISSNELGMGAIMNAFRLAIVGAGKGPHLFDIIAMIGKADTIARMEKASAELPA